MATILLQAAGSFLGGMLGPVGSTIGSAAGAMAGYMIDRSLIESTRRIEGPRLTTARAFSAEEGAPLARVYGTVRVSGNVIWATRFEESRSTSRQGGKGRGPKVTTYSYFCNAAFALCEGEIAGVRRIWADGREVDLEEVTVRIYRGTEAQAVDPLIAAKQGSGNAPAYRGVAYAVFERLPLDAYGNRIPQFQFEVMRPVGDLHRQVRAVALLPGSTEFGLLPRPVTRVPRPGETVHVNRHVLHGPSDLVASLDELQTLCPNLEEVAVIVTWFGDDLRAGSCKIQPAVAHGATGGYSETWRVSGVQRGSAKISSVVDGVASFGGSPSDRSVTECISEIRRRGLRVALYPFVMMDIPPENGLPDPYGGTEQPAFPWRGRITCHPAPGFPESADKSSAARTQVAAFCGSALPGHFSASGGMVNYSGPSGDWGYRRLILHYARLAAASGGVDTFLLGSELRGLTTLRDGENAFPFVEALVQLASEVRTILGSEAAITYGADWSEYFGYHPADGSGDVFFHLDQLWAHPAITAVGIDNYIPLSDWRDADYGGGNADGFLGPYDRAGLRSQIEAGEGYDWYYGGEFDRISRERTNITDGAHGKPWVFRFKDIRSWWENEHFDRIGGVEVETPTLWQPCSKPIWFTELGCPAVDKGANQPNVFPDPKSYENSVPHFSNGGRSDVAQARYIQAHLDHWGPGSRFFVEGSNPISAVYDGRMVDRSRIYLWAWDARPFPAFPLRTDEWRDGDNWQCGHWLNGRLSGVLISDLVSAILADHGLHGINTDGLGGSATGYMIDAPTTARAALEPLARVSGIAAFDENGILTFRDDFSNASAVRKIDDLVVEDGGPILERTRHPDDELPHSAELAFIDPLHDYQAALTRSAPLGLGGGTEHALVYPGTMEAGAASAYVSDWVLQKRISREGIGFSVPASDVDMSVGQLVQLPKTLGSNTYLITQVETGLVRRVLARRVVRTAPTPWRGGRPVAPSVPSIAGAPHVLLLDLPILSGNAAPEEHFRIASFASPWRGQAIYNSPEETGFVHVGSVAVPATIGEIVSAVTGGPRGRLDFAGSITVSLYHGELSSISMSRLLNGGNTAAIRGDSGTWEIIQFRLAEEIEPSVWRLTQLLRGQAGTEDAMEAGAEAGAPFVVLDEAVVRAGLLPEQAGMPITWRVGPAGQYFGADSFVRLTETGGVRSRLPLSPVHVRMSRTADGGAAFSWIRRGRIEADSWLAEDIPLGEESERYRVEVSLPDGSGIRTVNVDEPRWVYAADDIAADFGILPAEFEISIRQISASIGVGLPLRKAFVLNA